jgi:DNA-binding transcriptional LysR family regulator
VARRSALRFRPCQRSLTIRALAVPADVKKYSGKRASSGSVLGLLFAAQSGSGLALLPCHIGDPEPGLVRVMDPPAGLTSDLWILTHADLHKTPKVRVFFDFMAAEIERYRPLLLGRTRPPRPAAPAECTPAAGEGG